MIKQSRTIFSDFENAFLSVVQHAVWNRLNSKEGLLKDLQFIKDLLEKIYKLLNN